jgi:hypothetical protein
MKNKTWCGIVAGCCLLLPGRLAAADTAAQEHEVTQMEPVTVTAWRPVTASSEQLIPDKDFELRPQGRPADLLRLSPGLVIAQHAGGGKADQTFLRGFDNDHGTDIALFVDGVPINLRSHAHGQGYADLHFLIPETVEHMEVSKGPFQVEAGDFATSGTVNFVRREFVEENAFQTGFGPFDTQRHLWLLSPIKQPTLKSLVAVELYHTDGPFKNNEKYDRLNMYGRLTWRPTEMLDGALSYSHMQGAWHASGQIPLREVSAGRLDRFGAIDPSEGGDSQRTIITSEAAWRPSETQAAKTLVYVQRYNLDLFSNFTFFKDDPVNGDGIEQLDERWIIGSDSSYHHTVFPWDKETTASFGFQTRWGRGRVILATQQARNRLSETQDVDLSEVSYGPNLKLDSQLASWVRVVGGSRFDFFHFDVNDRLDSTLNGSEGDWVPSVKGNVILGPWAKTEVFLNAASGFHSNDARDVVSNPDTDTLPQAAGYEAGVRSRAFDRFDLSASVWLLNLDSELVFVGDSGETEAKGRSRRYGTELGARWHLTDWFSLNGDLTLSKAYFTATGGAVSRSPTLTARADATLRLPVGLESSMELRHVGTRWLVEDRSWEARGYTIFDWTTRFRPKQQHLHHLEAFFSLENVFDTDYREAQFLTETKLAGETDPVTDVHFSPGNPRTFLVGLTVYF